MKLPVALLLTTACFQTIDSYKILVIFAMPGKSHSILGEAVVKHLAAAGHDITYITARPQKKPPKNLRQIDVNENIKTMPKYQLKSLMKNSWINMAFAFQGMLDVTEATYQNADVKAMLLDKNQEFDLVIASWMFSELYSGFAAIFGAPLIWFCTSEPHWMVFRLIDEATNPAYTADITSSIMPPFTLVERSIQLGRQVAVHILKLLYVDAFEHRVYSTLTPYFTARGREPTPYQEAAFNASLMLGNSHVSMGQSTHLPQSYKAIGGYHIDSQIEPLPEDLHNLLDNAQHGVIYFSMGSNLKSKDMPEELKTNLLKMFGELKQKVLWKFEEVLTELPSNVHIIQWAPQPAILAHSNCILFITHGGLSSTTETIHFAKPIIGIPVFGDQFTNVDRAVARGFAKRVDLSLDMVDTLRAAIEDILHDPRFLTKVKELSLIYHDRPVPPAKEMVHWVEHVIKTSSAPHLRSPALSVPFYQKMYIDLLALIILSFFAIKMLLLGLRLALNKCCKKGKIQ